MAQLIDLQSFRARRERDEDAASERSAAERAGRVLLFTGVRYERMEAEPVRGRAGA